MDSLPICYLLLVLVPPLLYYILKSSIGSRHHTGMLLPPGPWQLPFIGSLHHLRGAGTLSHHALRDLSLCHGPLMFLKLGEIPVIVASSRQAAMEVMRTHDAVLASRPRTITGQILTKEGPDIVLSPYGELWRHLRKICTQELLSAKNVQSFRPIREHEAMRLIQAIRVSSAPHPHVINLNGFLSSYANDVTMRAVVGDTFDDRGIFLRYVAEAFRLGGTFRLADLFPSSRLARALSRNRMRKTEADVKELFRIMDGMINQHVERKSSTRKEEHGEEDLIDVLLRVQRESCLRFPITMATIKGVIFDLLAAGSESTSYVLQWAMAELMRKPVVMSRAQTEVRNAFKGLQMKVPEDGVSKLSYLRCVIKETLRLHPPGPFVLPRESQETCRIMGYDVPKGAMVLVNAWAISRDPKYWEDPVTFKPERFESDTRDFRGHDFEFTPFGAGRRICPGMLFGTANIELALAHLLFYFDWNLPDDTSASELDMTETVGITARRKGDLLLKPILQVPFASMNELP